MPPRRRAGVQLGHLLHLNLGMHRRRGSYSTESGLLPPERHSSEIGRAMLGFLAPHVPTDDEYRTKEALRQELERLVARIRPHAQLVAFGSMATGFALHHSGTKRCLPDLDLCCFGLDPEHGTTLMEWIALLAERIRAGTSRP